MHKNNKITFYKKNSVFRFSVIQFNFRMHKKEPWFSCYFVFLFLLDSRLYACGQQIWLFLCIRTGSLVFTLWLTKLRKLFFMHSDSTGFYQSVILLFLCIPAIIGVTTKSDQKNRGSPRRALVQIPAPRPFFFEQAV